MSRQPQVPTLRMPRNRQPVLGGTLVSAVFHGFLVMLVVWTGQQVAEGEFRTAGGPGPLGGGGGGGGSRITHIELPPFVTAASPAAQVQEDRPAIELPIPRPNLREIPPEDRVVRIARPTGPVVSAVAIGRGPGSGGDDGAGTGHGGGVGSGQGTGVGSGTGPGTGGEGGDAFGPRSRQMLLPPPDAPPSVKGQTFKVRFWIDERGRVTRIDVDPRIPDASYRGDFEDRMKQFRFYPAVNAEGTPIASYYDVEITP